MYGDDGSNYLTVAGYEFIGENFVDKWNKNPIFIEHGIQLDKAKRNG